MNILNPSKVRYIVVHCSATPEGKDFTVKDIDSWHKQRGFEMCGYHKVIYRDGSVHDGRPMKYVGAHAGAKYNPISVGVCYIGGVRPSPRGGWEGVDTRTPEQKVALLELLRELKAKFPKVKIVGHRELVCHFPKAGDNWTCAKCIARFGSCKYAEKSCPSFDVQSEYKL